MNTVPLKTNLFFTSKIISYESVVKKQYFKTVNAFTTLVELSRYINA